LLLGASGVDAGVCWRVFSCISLRHDSCGLFLLFSGGFLTGFLFEPGDCMTTDFPFFVFFSPPKLISASCTGLLVNNILPIQKKKKY
jgi:hypothetical protein